MFSLLLKKTYTKIIGLKVSSEKLLFRFLEKERVDFSSKELIHNRLSIDGIGELLVAHHGKIMSI